MTCGWALQYVHEELGWSHLDSYRSIFYAYAVLGLIKTSLAILLSTAVEFEPEIDKQAKGQRAMPRHPAETAPLLQNNSTEDPFAGDQDEPPQSRPRSFGGISHASMRIALPLCIMFALDSFGSSLTPQ